MVVDCFRFHAFLFHLRSCRCHVYYEPAHCRTYLPPPPRPPSGPSPLQLMVQNFLNELMRECGHAIQPGDACLAVSVNAEKGFAFAEVFIRDTPQRGQ